MKWASFLIGVGTGSLIACYLKYRSKAHQGLIPTKYMLWIGIVALSAGLFLELTELTS